MRRLVLRLVQAFALLMVFLLAYAGAWSFRHREQLFAPPHTLVVFGTERCSITTAMRRGLEAEGIPFVFANIDDTSNYAQMLVRTGKHRNLQPSGSVKLPVVSLDGVTHERPALEEVVARYRSAVSAPASPNT